MAHPGVGEPVGEDWTGLIGFYVFEHPFEVWLLLAFADIGRVAAGLNADGATIDDGAGH